MLSPALSGAAQSRMSTTPRRLHAAMLARRRDREDEREGGEDGPRRNRSWHEHHRHERHRSDGETLSLLVRDDSSSSSSKSGGSPHKASDSGSQVAHVTNAVLYGVINSILTIPCMYGYAAIIFSHPDFAAFMPALSKLVLFSSVVHQVMFTLLSSLPFAIGQVQDAGLIFLSAIATSICNSLGEDVSLETKVTTTVVTIGIATAALGGCLVAIGRFRLAGLVSYLPMPVVGGYLAFIGLFCMYAGLSLSTGLVINDFTSLLQIAEDPRAILLCVPGIFGGLAFLVVSQRTENSFALPACILGMPLAFFAILALTGVSLEDARDFGWVSGDAPPAGFSEMWGLFDFSLVQWGQLPRQITTWLGMVFVVAFSSCLDVAAIEMDMGRQLNINHELSSVGWSNVVSGLLGGYTGSYIFSQTIFTFRSRTNSRIVGVCVIVSEFAIVLLPLSVMSYIPRFFFAATLIFVAIDLMLEWLVHVRHKVLTREYIVLWLSFLAINWVSLELGMLLGIGFAIINFLLGYAQVRVVTRRTRTSAAVRQLAARTALARRRDAIVYLELYGYLFFGSSVQILADVQRAVHIRKHDDHSRSEYQSSGNGNGSASPTSLTSPPNEVPVQCLDGSELVDGAGFGTPTEYLVLDFARVSGMDATAARSSFMILMQHCKRHGIKVLFVDVLPNIRWLLLNNEICEENNFRPNADIALEFCENKLLATYHGANTPSSTRIINSINGHESMAVLLHRFMGKADDAEDFAGIESFFVERAVPAGHEFYRVGDDIAGFFFLARGRVALYMNADGSVDRSRHKSGEPLKQTMLEHVIPGAMFGEVDFVSRRQTRSMSARALQPCVVFELTREAIDEMRERAPEMWDKLRDVVMQTMALAITYTMSVQSANNETDFPHHREEAYQTP